MVMWWEFWGTNCEWPKEVAQPISHQTKDRDDWKGIYIAFTQDSHISQTNPIRKMCESWVKVVWILKKDASDFSCFYKVIYCPHMHNMYFILSILAWRVVKCKNFACFCSSVLEFCQWFNWNGIFQYYGLAFSTDFSNKSHLREMLRIFQAKHSYCKISLLIVWDTLASTWT